MKKNDEFVIKIEDMSEDGAGIGRLDGYIWFVKDTVIGDVVRAGAMKLKKTYGFARLIEVLEPSPDRVKPRCPVARQCGGCQLQMMDYEAQLRFKERKVYNNLRRIGGMENLRLPGEDEAAMSSRGAQYGEEQCGEAQSDGTQGAGTQHDGARHDGARHDGAQHDGARYNGARHNGAQHGAMQNGEAPGGSAQGAGAPVVRMEPIMGMENPWRYRNKAQFPFGRSKDGRIIAGFYAGRTHAIIESEDCLLGVEENREILGIVRAFMEQYGIDPYNEERHSGLVRHCLIRKGFATGELMVCLVINGRKIPHGEVLVERLKKVAGMTSISFNVNTEKTNVILGSEVVNLWGPGYITDYIGDVKYQISPLSFYQVNPVQTVKLYGTALEYAGLTGEETVWDLYCGIGTISLFLAQKAKKVYGVEIVPQAIEDARRNAEINGIKNVEFFVGKAEEVLPREFDEKNVYADVIVVDPPRKGCDQVCLETIVKMAPKKVVYVSCDSATLGRDVKYLREMGYEVTRVRCCDMFGGSGHVETVVQMRNCGLKKIEE